MFGKLLKLIGILLLTGGVIFLGLFWMATRRVPAPNGSYDYDAYPDPIEEAFSQRY